MQQSTTSASAVSRPLSPRCRGRRHRFRLTVQVAEDGLRRKNIALWCAVVVLGACGEFRNAVEGDSTAPEAGSWLIDAEPSLVIGHEGDPDYEFTSIVGLGGLSSGGWFAFDRGANELRFFDEQGRLSRKVGGPGSGPGEFRDVYVVIPMPGDSILIYDQRLQRLTMVQPGRDDVRAWRAPVPPNGGFIQPAGLLNTNELLWSELRLAPCRPNAIAWDSVAYYRVRINALQTDATLGERTGRTNTLLPLGRWPNRQRWGDVSSGRCFPLVVPFAPVHLTYVHQGRLYVSAGDRLEVRVIDLEAGREVLVARVAGDRRRALSRQRIAEYIQSAVGAAGLDEVGRPITGGGGIGTYQRALENLPYPDSLPVTGQLVVDARGYTWVREYAPPDSGQAVWWIFSREGDLTERFTFPEQIDGDRFRVVQIGEDYIAGVHRDAFNVESIRVYALHRGRSAAGSMDR